MTNLADTSIPPWVHDDTPTTLDDTGSAYILVGVGADAEALLERWRVGLVDRPVTVIAEANLTSAGAALNESLTRAQVGIRVRLTGPAGACLTLRANALAAGLEDDEICVVASRTGEIDVLCTHCRTPTSTTAGVGETVTCSGCSRTLFIYHHVSRRLGQFMGFMVDAETAVVAR